MDCPDIAEAFLCDSLPPRFLDQLWAQGWRHFGHQFYRYSKQSDEAGGECTILPLRIDLEGFRRSKSQRRTWRRNLDLEVRVMPARIRDITERLFDEHKRRFDRNQPQALSDFLGASPELGPCVCEETQCWLDEELVAVSYMDVGTSAGSGVYAMFKPEVPERRLGIWTMLAEIERCRDRGFRWYYPGYATVQPGHYDYKKQFWGLEGWDWAREEWNCLGRVKV